MFNKYQRKYMEHISIIPREQRCKCGWYLKNECPHCATKKPDKAALAAAKEG